MRMVMRSPMVAVLALALMPVVRAATPATDESDEKEPFTRLTVDEVAKMMTDPGVHVYDGNRKDVYKKNHLKGAVRLYSKDIKEGVLPPEKDTTLIFYCQNVH